ncbi:MAG: POTRA domain-containing protein, partial [Bacteroidota bacterium]
MKLKANFIPTILFIGFATIMSSCSSVKYLKENEALLIKNRISCDNLSINKEDVATYLRQKPNRKIFGFVPLKLWIYNWVNPEKEEIRDIKREKKLNEINKKRDAKGKKPKTRRYFTKWLLKNGEAPVVLDTSLVLNSADIIKKYVSSKGYFNAEVSSKVEYLKRKKAVVKYNITTKDPYVIKSIEYSSSDTNLLSYVYADTSNSLIKPNMPCDFDVLDNERDRVVLSLKQEGFYYFNKDFISYRLDTLNGMNSVKVYALIKKNTYKLTGDDNIYTENHKQYL